jgi:hypothetical protein
MTNQKPEKLSQEEIEKRKKDLEKFYKSQIPFLKTEVEFEELNTRISKARVEQLLLDRKFVELMMEQESMMKPQEPIKTEE